MAAAGPSRVLTFFAARQRLAIDADAVAEVALAPKVTRVPQAPPALAGLASLRGRVAPIVSMSALLGLPQSAAGGRVIVLDRAEPIGLAVDSVDGMQALAGEVGGGLIDADGGPIRLLDIEPLLAEAFAGLARIAPAAKATPARDQPSAGGEQNADAPFLTFDVAGQTYALPLAQVVEVIGVPQTITRLPQTDAVAVGLAPLRGELLPLISLSALLGLPRDADDDDAVVVTSLGEAMIGLVVGQVRAILRVPDNAIGPVPSILNRGAGEARIAFLARTAGGVVSILAVDQIFQEATVARVLAEGAGQMRSEREEGGRRSMEQFVLFRLGDERYGLPLASVDEVLMLPKRWTRVPHAPAFILGVVNHRGEVLPLVDQRRRFAVDVAAGAAQQRVIVARLGDMVIGFVVDAVERIFEVPPEALAPTPNLTGEGASIFDRVSTLEVDGRLVLLIDARQLLDQAEQDLVKALAAQGLSAEAETP